MLTALGILLSSTGVGSIIGILGGLANRWFDARDKIADREFELRKLDKEKEYMATEYANRMAIATKEGEAKVEAAEKEAEGKIESAGYKAMTASYNFAAPTREDGWIDTASKLIRPLLTICFFLFTIYVFAQIQTMISEADTSFTSDQLLKIYTYIIEWIFFQAGTAIGWWYAMRPGRVSVLGERK